MADKTINVRHVQKHDTESNWSSKDPVLLAGEMAFTTDGTNTGKYKLGDGTSKWSALSYAKARLEKADVTTALGYTPPTTNTTYSDMKGATTSAAGTHGLVPAPASGDANRYLRSDGSWVVPPDTNTTYSAATTSANGLMTSAMVTKLNGIATGANAYTHPTTSGNKHIPSGGSSGQILRWSADGTAVWGADNNTTYSNFVKSGSGAAAGLVPAPSTTAGTTKYLREDGTWSVPPDNNTTYSSKAAVSGGTDVSLVTTGEKAVWNAKTSNTGTLTGIKMNGSSKGTSGVVDLGTVLTGGSQTTTSSADGGSNVYTFSDGSTITIKNGSKGSSGTNGTNGTNGTSAVWFTGTTVTGTSTTATSFTVSGSKAGDMYLNSSTYNVYKASAASKWVYVCNIKGATGAKGDAGTNGTNGTTPTIKVAAGSNINSVGTPSVTASTSDTTTTLTFNYLKGATGTNATTTSVATSSANGLMSKTDKAKLDGMTLMTATEFEALFE